MKDAARDDDAELASITPRVESDAVAKRSSPRARVLVADDDDDTRFALTMLLEAEGFEVASAADGPATLRLLGEIRPDVLLTDLRMPGVVDDALVRGARAIVPPSVVVIVMTAFGDVESAVAAMRAGADDYLTKPIQIDRLAKAVEQAIEQRALRHEAALERERLDRSGEAATFVGASPLMQRVFGVIDRVAPTRATVLVTGESGTGKALVARAIHERSPCRGGPFVRVDCGLDAATLAEDLGGDDARDGLLGRARGGTIFLDDVERLPRAQQTRLLRWLREPSLERAGAAPGGADARVVAASERDLAVEVRAGRFREDLFHRLAVVTIEMPALSARPMDIVPLATLFLARFTRAHGKTIRGFEDEALARVAKYRWPGNVGELETAIERAVVLCEGELLRARDLVVSTAPLPFRGRVPGATLEEVERDAILSTLEAVDGNTAKAAAMLRISVRKIQYRIRAYDASPRTPEPPPGLEPAPRRARRPRPR